MTRKELLQSVIDDYSRHECKQIELVWTTGERSGIGNQKAINVAMEALKGELKRQMEELNS